MEPKLAKSVKITVNDVYLWRNEESLDQVDEHHQEVFNATISQGRRKIEIFRTVVSLVETPEYAKFCKLSKNQLSSDIKKIQRWGANWHKKPSC